MAFFLAPKTAGETVQRRWTVPVDADDKPASAALSATGITVSANSFEGDELVLTLAGGTAAATSTIVATITTSRGRVLVETLYIPVIDSAAQIADTARDYIAFALRKVAGIGVVVDADEEADALERLSGLIAHWREQGADIGAPFPLNDNSVIYCPDYASRGLRYALLVECASLYDYQPTPYELSAALRGLQTIKHKNLPDVRTVSFF